MPYIPKEERKILNPHINAIADLIGPPGHLTYVICVLMWRLWKRSGPSFTNWGLLRFAVEEAVSDFRDRHVSWLDGQGYERQKMLENGDVYE